jgi:hypothetical protein
MPARDPYRRIYRVLRLGSADSEQKLFHREELEGPVTAPVSSTVRKELHLDEPLKPSRESFAERLERLGQGKGRK